MSVSPASMIVIAPVEGPDPLRTQARDHMDQFVAAGDQAAVGDLTRLECRVRPIGLGAASLLADQETSFAAPDPRMLALPGPISSSSGRP